MKPDGSGRRKVTDTPIIDIRIVSPDRRWLMAGVPVNEVPSTADVAFPIDGGEPQRICPAICMSKWSPDGSRFYVYCRTARPQGAAVVIPVLKGRSLPDLPPEGIRWTPGVGGKLIDLSLIDPGLGGYNVAPGPAEDTFVYVKTTAHRNLFQIPWQLWQRIKQYFSTQERLEEFAALFVPQGPHRIDARGTVSHAFVDDHHP